MKDARLAIERTIKELRQKHNCYHRSLITDYSAEPESIRVFRVFRVIRGSLCLL